ncbi:hypothetical protein KAR91_35265 [Candidatus Pacearchaeota archaeon]|nr:hypothetical protein [Candidatus Pacearchaeota archaeon]
MQSKRKVISFAPNKLCHLYLDKIQKDLGTTRPSVLMNKMTSEYFLMKYGADERKIIRDKFLEEEFKNY